MGSCCLFLAMSSWRAVILDTGYSIPDDRHLRTGQNVIEYRESSIEYHVEYLKI